MHPLGQTRTTIHANHAFIAPDSHVTAALPGWTKTAGVILISPHLRGHPRFSQYLAHMQPDATAAPPIAGVQRFLYVIEGTLHASIAAQETITLNAGDFAYIPADTSQDITTQEETHLLIFEKPYVPYGDELPHIHTGDAWAADAVPFMGDEATGLRTLLPTDIAYDMAVNLFSFQPGAALPFVETHIMEHGLYLLEGQGIYRLDDCWYPIHTGDTIWMASYCPQWFCAIGKTRSTYIYYKDINRDPLS